MALMCLSLVELLRQPMLGQIPALMYMLSDMRGLLQLHPVKLGG
jgi:hypothetical protein